MTIIELTVRLAIAFITLLVLTRLMGRKEISQMTFFNFISAISIGTIGASLAIDSSLSVRNGLFALFFWSLFTIILGILNIKSKPIRHIVVGHSLVLIRKGEIDMGALRKCRLDLNSLQALLRKKNVFSFSEVDYAFFETDGGLSVLKKEPMLPAAKSDILPAASQDYLYPISFPIISDGKYEKENVVQFAIECSQIEQKLNDMGISSVNDVFYAEMQKDGTLFIQSKKRSEH